MAGVYSLLHCLLLFISNGLVFGQMKAYTWDEMDCPQENTPMMVTEVNWGVAGRAYKTLPPGLVIAPSKMPYAGFGVISETFIPKYTWLGSFDGEMVHVEDGEHISRYAWQVRRGGEITAYIDGFHLHLSNYQRYMNAPLRYRDESVIVAECLGKIYYVTNKDILPGEELLISYGPYYDLGVNMDLNVYYEVPNEFLDGGLDLNREDHRMALGRFWIELYQVKHLSSSWISKILGLNYRKKIQV